MKKVAPLLQSSLEGESGSKTVFIFLANIEHTSVTNVKA